MSRRAATRPDRVAELRIGLVLIGLFILTAAISPEAAGQRRATPPAYSAWGRVLARCASPQGFDYRRLARDKADLDRALVELSTVTAQEFEGLGRRDRQAFLINAHNIHVVARVMRFYPIESIEETSLWGSALKRRAAYVLGRPWSIRELRNEIMGPRYRDVRAVFLLNWGMRGCASLADVPATGANLESLLERRARAFLADPDYNRYDRKGQKYYASRLLKDYRKDIERDYATLWKFLSRFAPGNEVVHMERRPPKLEFLKFNRSLNDFPAPTLPPPVELPVEFEDPGVP